ncbi:hypothetical protein ACFE04_011265 [Oxalis oulophora]
MAFANWMNKLRAKEKVKSPKKATSNGKEVLKPPTSKEAPSNATKQKAAAAKEYIENHYKKQMKNLQEREERYYFYYLMLLVLISNNRLNGLDSGSDMPFPDGHEEQDVTVKSRGGSQMQKTSPSSSKSPGKVVTSSRGVLGNLAEKSTDNHIDIHTIPVAQLATHPAYKRIRLGSSYASPIPSSSADYLCVMFALWFFLPL